MQEIPQRVSLVLQTEKILLRSIGRGTWKFTLPGERTLAQKLQVSRGTLRAALQRLERRNLIRVHQGRPYEIVRKARPPPGQPAISRVILLTPDRTWRLAPFVIVYMDDLRGRLQRLGVQLEFHHSPRFFSADCARALSKLVDQNPHCGWLLLLSTRAMQCWFRDRGVPTVITGSLYPDVNIPSIDIDFHAVGQHAGGMMFARGHRNIALLASTLERGVAAPGTLEIERGLRQAFAASRHADKELTVAYHEPDVDSVRSHLDRLLNLPRRPTVLLIGHATTLLTALSHLAQRRIVVPSDLSIIITHSEPFYRHFVPELTHYEWDAERFSSEVTRLFQHAFNGESIPEKKIRLVPHFVPGKTLISI